MVEFSNQLTAAQAERLAILAEECGEVIQIVGKILRHGYCPRSSDGMRCTINRTYLEKELGDVKWITNLMCVERDVDRGLVDEFARDRAFNAAPYLHHQEGSK
jgi:NTP pyrophosphatase (non-canonical NTP hydrolase)